MSTRAFSLIVALFVLFLFYGYDINNKIQQHNKHISQLWLIIEAKYQQRNMQLSMVLKEFSVTNNQDELGKVLANVMTAKETLGNITTNPNIPHQQDVFKPFIQAQSQLSAALNALFIATEKSIKPSVVILKKHQQAIDALHGDYDKGVADYNLMVSRFPGSVFAEMKGYQLMYRLDGSQSSKVVISNSNRVDFNMLAAPIPKQ